MKRLGPFLLSLVIGTALAADATLTWQNPQPLKPTGTVLQYTLNNKAWVCNVDYVAFDSRIKRFDVGAASGCVAIPKPVFVLKNDTGKDYGLVVYHAGLFDTRTFVAEVALASFWDGHVRYMFNLK